MSKKVSIIIPIHNVENYINKCLDSVVQQTYANIEAILIDDGSTDKSGIIAKEYAQKYGWIYEYIEMGGASKARNYALRKVTGDYILLLDGDDYLLPNLVEKVVNQAETEDLEVYGFSAYTFRDDAEDVLEWNTSGYKYKGQYDRVYSGSELLTSLIANQDQDITCCWIFMIRKSYWDSLQIQFPEGIILEDNYVHLMMLAKAKKIRIENIPLYCHRYHSKSVMATANTEKLLKATHRLLVETEKAVDEDKVLDEKVIGWYMHDYAWKYAGNWAKTEIQNKQQLSDLTKDVREISRQHHCWQDNKLKLFVYMPLIFRVRQGLRNTIKERI